MVFRFGWISGIVGLVFREFRFWVVGNKKIMEGLRRKGLSWVLEEVLGIWVCLW